MKASNNIDNNWAGIWALAFGVSGIMIGEFLPAGLLTPMAKDLNISEGMAGQTVTITSIFAVLASLLSAYATRNFDRKKVLLVFSICTMASSLIVSYSTNFYLILFGRALLGVALGGFWSMSTAIAIRLVEEKYIPKALSIIFGAASFSAMLAAPLGSFLGDIFGWRNVFLLNTLVGIVGIIWLLISMPKLNPLGNIKLRTIVDVLKIPSIKVGMIAIALAFCGRFASITYLRPYLERDVGLAGHNLSIMFLAFDLAYFVGTLFAGRIVSKHLGASMKLSPLILAISSIGLIFSGPSLIATTVLILILGAAFAPIPVSWSTWGSKMSPEHAETIGGLYVASVQLSAAVGASLGGVIFDLSGSSGVFTMSGLTCIFSTILVIFFVKTNFKNEEKLNV